LALSQRSKTLKRNEKGIKKKWAQSKKSTRGFPAIPNQRHYTNTNKTWRHQDPKGGWSRAKRIAVISGDEFGESKSAGGAFPEMRGARLSNEKKAGVRAPSGDNLNTS